jgi:hypothetical protein
MKKPSMEYMKGYSNGYKPPKGSAGGEAFGAYSHKKNPRKVPMKGSEIKSYSDYGRNPDAAKVMRLKGEQARNESLRGEPC